MARNVGTNLGGDFYKSVTRTTGRYYKRKVPDLRYDGPSCAVTEAKASYAAIFYPVCPEEIAAIVRARSPTCPTSSSTGTSSTATGATRSSSGSTRWSGTSITPG
jgi:hypothetical protein